MSQFYLVGWKEFLKRKIINRAELVKEENEKEALGKMLEFNKHKPTSTVDYVVYPLSKLMEKRGLEFKELITKEKVFENFKINYEKPTPIEEDVQENESEPETDVKDDKPDIELTSAPTEVKNMHEKEKGPEFEFPDQVEARKSQK